jgi:hypothetical protein
MTERSERMSKQNLAGMLKRAAPLILVAVQALFGLQIIHTLPAPGPQVMGVVSDGCFLWCADPSMDRIDRMDPWTGEVLESLPYELLDGYAGLGWDPEGILWVAQKRQIQRIIPGSSVKLTPVVAPGC